MPLPEPTNHFSIAQICERWNCDIQLLIEYCLCQMLEIGTVLTDELVYTTYTDSDDTHNGNPEAVSGFFLIDCEEIAQIHTNPPATIYEVYLNTHGAGGLRSRITYYLLGAHELSVNDLRISRKERDRFEHEHQIDVSATIILPPRVDTEPEVKQRERELVLIGWLHGRGIDTSEPLECTQEELWDLLREADPRVFPPLGKVAIKKFFAKHRFCSFRRGRPPGT